MRLTEFLIETGNAPAPFRLVNPDDEVWEIAAPDIGMSMYLVRRRGTSGKIDEVFIEFAVNGQYNITGTGNAFKVVSTAEAMLAKYLKGYLQSTDRVVTFGAEKSEPSRIRLYNRLAPRMNRILGPQWVYGNPDGEGSLQEYVWTKQTALKEKAVQSTWITDLRHAREKKELTMTLNNGRQFLIPGVTRTTFEQWTRAPSKGRYFHNRIKGKYQVTRTK